MRTTFKLRLKIDLVRFIVFFGMIILLLSCEKEADVVENSVYTFDVTKVSALSEDFVVINSYFNEDSIGKFNFDSEAILGNDTIVFRLFNNLGVGKDTVTGSDEMSIFKDIPLDPIVKYSLNEFFAKKVIVSWDIQKNNHLVDSITTKIFGKDSQVRNLSLESSPFDSCIYINFLVFNKFGKAEIDNENPNMNDYLNYSSSKYSGLESDEIIISSQLFRSIYGDKYTSSMTLGTSLSCQFKIAGIDCSSGKETEILREAMDMIKKGMAQNANWYDLTGKSKYFKSSFILGIISTSIPSSSAIWGMDDVINEFTAIDSLYKNADFGILGKGYESFSTLYPKYEFNN